LPGSLVYLDASALVKLIVAEPESSALESFLGDRPTTVTSRLSAVEVARVSRRTAMRKVVERAEGLLDSIAFVELSSEIARAAGRLDLPALRSLDAIHVASALALGADAGPFVTYDDRMLAAASAAGLAVQAPV